jgi:hypothetical protein
MEILIEDLVAKIKAVFDTTKVLSVKTVYEKINGSDELRLVVSMDKILYDDVNIIYTKLIFTTNKDKFKLTKNYFTYLFDINCEYVRIEFTDLNDFSTKISNIFKENKFGDNIKILSDFIKSPSTLINKWFEKNNITNISILNVEQKTISIMPCKLLSFSFIIELNNNDKVDLTISKEGEKDYLFKFKIFNNIYEDNESNLNRLVETIGSNIKNNVKM